MPLSLLNHSALALFAQRTRIPTSARSIGFCAIWVCISSSSNQGPGPSKEQGPSLLDYRDEPGAWFNEQEIPFLGRVFMSSLPSLAM